jgi:type VI secretion system protein ImpK
MLGDAAVTNLDRGGDTLAHLYEGLLTAAIRIQTGNQPLGDLDALFRRTKRAFDQITRQASDLEYSSAIEEDARFAVVAFFDEAVLTSADPQQHDWAHRRLQDAMFQVSNAGEKFFEKLERLLARPDSPELGDVLEVYAQCLLLGFEGMYAGPRHNELGRITSNVNRRIDRIRGANAKLSPQYQSTPERLPVASKNPWDERMKRFALVTAAFVIVIYAIAKLHLTWKTSLIQSALSPYLP